MVLSIWEMFIALFGRGEKGREDSEGENQESRFVPSPLDLSVRIGHGGRDGEVLRELSKIDEQAQEFEEPRRDR